MAIYDCFQYFNEDHIVDLRLNVLDKFVDYFVISESTKTHQGKTKKLNFDVKKFSKFKKKERSPRARDSTKRCYKDCNSSKIKKGRLAHYFGRYHCCGLSR